MTSTMQLPKLPEYLLNSWRLQRDDAWEARKRKDLKDWKASLLTETYLRYQLQYNSRIKEEQEQEKANPATLSYIAAGRVLDVLNAAENLEADLSTIMRSLNSTTARQLLADPRTPYRVLRAFHGYLQNNTKRKTTDEPRGIVDVDEAIIAQERYIRSRSDANKDSRYLVSMPELSSILLSSPGSSTDDLKLEFVRQDPPKGGLELLDAYRERVMHIQPNDAVFAATFDRITKGTLRGLDWNNVFVAGGMALTTLTHIYPSKDNDRDVRDCDIDLYLYDLTPEEANRKVEEIYNIWSSNLPSMNKQKLVVKNAKTINLLPSYPNRRIQIILKLLSSPTQILLNFDLDACAIGFDGSRVLMLPRFARAVETGYSVFTMDLVWGHHLGNRRATQERRVFKYADRGFGIRILPSYARSLEEDNLEKALGIVGSARPESTRAHDDMIDDEEIEEEFRFPPFALEQPERNRKPDGPEPGLKTLKRVAYLGQDFVNRFYFGATPLTVYPYSDEYIIAQMDIDGADDLKLREEKWMAEVRKVESTNKALREIDDNQRLLVATEYGPFLSYATLDTDTMHGGLPDGRRGMGAFELFVRHCEAWRLHARVDATLEKTSFASTVYDPETYDDLPTYSWDEDLDLEYFARKIDIGNDRLFASLKTAICHKLDSHYLTRRIRRQVHGPDLASVQEKQITIPLMLPYDLENFILNDIPNRYTDLPHHYTAFKPLIAIHDPMAHDPTRPTLPPLHDAVNESGNLRYWVITNEAIWAGQHHAMDEIAEVLWALFHWLNQETGKEDQAFTDGEGTDVQQCVWHLARSFRRRIVLPEITSHGISQTSTSARRAGLPTLRESLLFRPWVFYTPKVPYRDPEVDEDENLPPHELFDEVQSLYPFPDDLFWKEGDEGEWNGDGVPVWKDVGRDAKAGDGVRREDLKGEETVLTDEIIALVEAREKLQMMVGSQYDGSDMEVDDDMEDASEM